MSFFQQALQGVSGKPKLSAKQKAELSSAIADACMARVGLQGCEIDCAANNDPKTRGLLSVSLALSGTWGDSFRSVLQATTGGDYTSPATPVNQASEIADQAVLASGVLDKGHWDAYRKCISDQTCLSSED